MMDVKHCRGCRENFYNGNNPLGVQRCWMLDDARVVTRYELSTSTPMNIRGAYLKVRQPQCYSAKGVIYLKEIPAYAK